jgi:diamine N-acetyltransferase
VSLEEEQAWVEKMIASDSDHVFVVERIEDSKYIGNVGVHEIYHPARRGRVGIFIRESNQGYGKEALQLICHAAFTHLNLHKLWLIHYKDNARMHHITEKLGFLVEGVMVEEYIDHQGVYHDMVRKYILETEYHRSNTNEN